MAGVKEKEPRPPRFLANELKRLHGHMLRWRARYGFEAIADFIVIYDSERDKLVEYYVIAAFDTLLGKERLEVEIQRKGKRVFFATIEEKGKPSVYMYAPHADIAIRILLDRVSESLGEVVEVGPDPFAEEYGGPHRGERREGGQLQG